MKVFTLIMMFLQDIDNFGCRPPDDVKRLPSRISFLLNVDLPWGENRNCSTKPMLKVLFIRLSGCSFFAHQLIYGTMPMGGCDPCWQCQHRFKEFRPLRHLKKWELKLAQKLDPTRWYHLGPKCRVCSYQLTLFLFCTIVCYLFIIYMYLAALHFYLSPAMCLFYYSGTFIVLRRIEQVTDNIALSQANLRDTSVQTTKLTIA